MNEAQPPFDENALSPEDQEVIRAFDALDTWKTDTTPLRTEHLAATEQTEELDVLLIFVTELEEDLAALRQSLHYLTQHSPSARQHFLPLQRLGHKIRGAAGAMECSVMSTIAEQIEARAQQVQQGQVEPSTALTLIQHAVTALEHTLLDFFETGQESTTYLEEWEQFSGHQPLALAQQGSSVENPSSAVAPDSAHGSVLSATTPLDQLHAHSDTPFRVDIRRITQLTRHSEQLAELHIPLNHAQEQLDAAFQELQKTQQRLQKIERELSALSTAAHPTRLVPDEHPTSSLIARILNEASQRNEYSHTRRIKPRPRLIKPHEAHTWDELEMERYTERDGLIRALNEALADLAIATSSAYTAYEQMQVVIQKYLGQATAVHNNIQLLRSAPLHMLLPQIQNTIASCATGLEQGIQFEVTGEATELDQNTLEALSAPLLQLVHTCIADISGTQPLASHEGRHRIWLHAQSLGNEVTLEMGFSMQVQGGSVEALRHAIEHLHGRLALQRNDAGGISFYLHLPRSHGTIRCLLITIGDQQMLVPFSQVQRIDDGREANFDILYSLDELLGSPTASTPKGGQKPDPLTTTHIQPVLLLVQRASRLLIGVKVDEVPGELEVVVKPLPSYMQRPGILGAAINGEGKVLFVLDLAAMTAHYTSLSRTQIPGAIQGSIAAAQKRQPTILIADDSTSIRQSLQRMLGSRAYLLYEARDGMEALEQLTKQPPDIFLLDMEMPNLNGYDLLSIMQLYPELAHVKVIMLTSRSSDKHRQRALELGALAYITKPCPQDILLETIERLLTL